MTQTDDDGALVRAGSLRPESERPIQSESEPRSLGNRIDALVIAYRVHLNADTKDALRRAAAVATEHGDAPLTLVNELGAGVVAIASQRGGGERVIFENGHLRGVFIESLAGEDPGWSLEIVARATWLASTPIDQVVSEVRRWAKLFGVVHEERLRRVDLCCDFENWDLREDDGASFVRHARSTLVGYTSQNKPGTEPVWGKTYRRASQQVTGFTVCPGNPLMLRLYDKSRELEVSGDSDKAALERVRWTEHGWTGGQVTRLEFQIRGQAAQELLNRSVDRLLEGCGGLWEYCTKWVRLVVPGTSERLRRCETDERWKAAQGVEWEGVRRKVQRERKTGATTTGQALGSVLSALAQSEAVPEADCDTEATLLEIGKQFAVVAASILKEKWGSEAAALAHLQTKMDVAIARAWERERGVNEK